MATLPATAAGEVRFTLRIPNGDGTDSPAQGYAWLYPNLTPGTVYRASNVDPQIATRTLLTFDGAGNLEDPETSAWAKVLASDAPGVSFAGMQWVLEFHVNDVKDQPKRKYFTVPAGSYVNVGLLADTSQQPSVQSVMLSTTDAATIAEKADAVLAVVASNDGIVSGLLQNEESATSKANAAAVAAQAGTDRDLLGFRAALAVNNLTGNAVDILVMGDSIAEGMGASTVTRRWSNRMVNRLRTRLAVTSSGVGFVPVRYASSTVAGDAWSAAGRITENTFGLGQKTSSLFLDGGTGLGDGTLTITRACSSFTLLAHRHPTSLTGLFVTVDGGTAQTWDVTAGTGVAEWPSAALTPGNHTVVVKARSAAPGYFEGAMFYNGDESTGIRLWDGSRSGTRAYQFTSEVANGTVWTDSLAHLAPDLVILEWLTNDVTDRTVAQYESDVRDVVDLLRGKVANVPILLLAMFEYGAGSLVAPWGDYLAALRRIRASYTNLGFLDLGERIPKLAGADTYANLYDPTHPNDKGHALIGETVAGFLLPH